MLTMADLIGIDWIREWLGAPAPIAVEIIYAERGESLDDLSARCDPFHPYHWQYRDVRVIGEVELTGAATLAAIANPIDRHYAILRDASLVRWP